MTIKLDKALDCIVIGGGPAGLTAAMYLARYRCSTIIYDTLDSRAARIPKSHNYPGFPEGIAGKDLLNRMRTQLLSYKVPLLNEAVETLQQEDNEEFIIGTSSGIKRAKNIILCTGVKDIEPHIGDVNDGIKRGLIRHCPVCDAFEVMNKKIAVIGTHKAGLKEALFLRGYTPHITLMSLGKKEKWSKEDLKKINDAQITVLSSEVAAIELLASSAKITFKDHKTIQFDTIYSAMGCIKNNQLVESLGVKLKNGCLIVNKKQQTSLKGLFAAGDIVSGLNQMCVATSQAAIAATAIQKELYIS